MKLHAAALLVTLLLSTYHAHASSARGMREDVDKAVAGIPDGYSRVGHRDTGISTASDRRAPVDVHETVMFTAEGDIYSKRVGSPSQFTKRLSDLGSVTTYAEVTNASITPSLFCETCPQTDTRKRLKDTTNTPWSAIGLIAKLDVSPLFAGLSQCSGAIIGPQRQHVLTAGHCLVSTDDGSGDSLSRIIYAPAINGNKLPFGAVRATKARVLREYVALRSFTALATNFDFGLITLNQSAPEGTSYLDIEAGSGVKTYNLTTAGYPADKNKDRSKGDFMYRVSCPNVEFSFDKGPKELKGCDRFCDNIVVHDCLSYEGQSGSAIWSTENKKQTIRAILTGAITVNKGPLYNTGTQINQLVYDVISAWYDEDLKEGKAVASPTPEPTPE